MILVVATLNVSPSGVDEFEAGFAANASRVQAEEPGCLIYQLCKDKKKPGRRGLTKAKTTPSRFAGVENEVVA